MRLLLDKPLKQGNVPDVKSTRIMPGYVVDEWKPGRGYVLLYENTNKRSNTAMIFVHGGGFTGLSPDESSYVYLAQKLCCDTGLTIIVPDYALAPYKSYPTQPNEILNTRVVFNLDYEHFILGSDSAGGAIAWSLLLKNPKAFDKAWFLSPWLNMRCDTASYTTREFCQKTQQGDRVFRKSAEKKKREYKKIAREYLGGDLRFKDKIANPFNSRNSELRTFPETLIMVGDEDSIRDDGLIMASKLQVAGVKCYASIYDGMWHDWMLYSQQSCPKAGKAAYEQVENFLLGTTKDCTARQGVLPSAEASVILST